MNTATRGRSAFRAGTLTQAALLLACGCAATAGWAQTAGGAQDPGTVVLNRYSTASTEPPAELLEPLDVVAALSFPRQNVSTIGEALGYALLRTGYRLIAAASIPQEARDYLALPLPESQRQIGPYKVRLILGALMGTAWQLRTDPLTRVVWIEPAGAYAHRIAGRAGSAPGASAQDGASAPPVPPTPIPAPASTPPVATAVPVPVPATAPSPASPAAPPAAVASLPPLPPPASIAPPPRPTRPGAASREWPTAGQKTLQGVLRQWSDAAGLALAWDSVNDYPLPAPAAKFTATGTLNQALAQLAQRMGTLSRPMAMVVSDGTLRVFEIE
ncbi:MAG: TcpQ domain-containing protein [Gammaproteobacteria bacterium]|uniref:PFGI-1 class ICE element type IV pilus protein PilL2 n=1 Tax=uncultured Pseudacidovorax sp. TaxID=679313 RepID=UPI0025F46C57|nr:TcpQ domain-containing protein [uncultured Pseudacidovorax sp.]